MASLDNLEKGKLERIFGMSGGYVLDFSNHTFADFVQTSVGFDPYDRYDGSKAVILRSIWQKEPDSVVGQLTIELLDRWRSERMLSGEGLNQAEEGLFVSMRQRLEELLAPAADSADLAFLDMDLGAIDLSRLQVSLTAQDVISQRLDEIDRCKRAEAPLAVIFLCGSTLEGLLLEVALAQQAAYLSSPSAPKRHDRAKPLREWTLANLIIVSRELGVVSEDVAKHAEAVRDFRNYIHPRQQMTQNFRPRMITAEIAQKVVLATLADLSRL